MKNPTLTLLAAIGLATTVISKYALNLYRWAKNYAEEGAKTISMDDLRRVFGLESVTDAKGKVIREAPLPLWANFQQRALNLAIAQVNATTDLKIKLASIERSKYRRVVSLTFTIKTQPIPKAHRSGDAFR